MHFEIYLQRKKIQVEVVARKKEEAMVNYCWAVFWGLTLLLSSL